MNRLTALLLGVATYVLASCSSPSVNLVDTNKDGFADVIETYEGGKLVKSVQDTDNDLIHDKELVFKYIGDRVFEHQHALGSTRVDLPVGNSVSNTISTAIRPYLTMAQDGSASYVKKHDLNEDGFIDGLEIGLHVRDSLTGDIIRTSTATFFDYNFDGIFEDIEVDDLVNNNVEYTHWFNPDTTSYSRTIVR